MTLSCGIGWVLRLLRQIGNHLLTLLVSFARALLAYRRPIAGVTMLALGVTLCWGGYTILHWRAPTEVAYNQAMAEIRKDLDYLKEYPSAWSRLTSEIPLLEKALAAYKQQAQAGPIDRILYGKPSPEYAAQIYLKEAVIYLMNSNGDQKKVAAAKKLLEAAIELNPGVPYARDLIADVSRVDTLAVQALAAQRNLEMLFEQNQQQRTKPTPKKQDGKGKGKSDKDGNQKGKPDEPNTAKPNGKPEDGDQKEGQDAMNSTLKQNMQDVQGGGSNDGI